MASKRLGGIDSQIRSSALRHARTIEERKNLQARIADMIVEAYDLPTSPDADPANPASSDLALFKECLKLFQPKDLDDLIYERNVDDRCGYALCPKPNQKLVHNGEKVWNKQGGKDFQLLDKADLERWCSDACGERTVFVKAQLSTEPAWLRTVETENIKLLDEVRNVDGLASALKTLAISSSKEEEIAEKLQTLSLERGEIHPPKGSSQVNIVEKASGSDTNPPTRLENNSSIEGYTPKKVRFDKD